MAIEETRKKIHFTPFDITKGPGVDSSPAPTLTLTQGSLRFNKSVIKELSLTGKFVRFFYDPVKKIIGFQIKTEVELRQLKGEGKWKMVNSNKVTGSWTVSVKKMVEQQFGMKTAEKKYPPFPVKKYIESSSAIHKGDVYYFVEIVDEVTKEDEPQLSPVSSGNGMIAA